MDIYTFLCDPLQKWRSCLSWLPSVDHYYRQTTIFHFFYFPVYSGTWELSLGIPSVVLEANSLFADLQFLSPFQGSVKFKGKIIALLENLKIVLNTSFFIFSISFSSASLFFNCSLSSFTASSSVSQMAFKNNSFHKDEEWKV